MVRTFKAFLKKQLLEEGSRRVAVSQFLARYRVTPCSSTGRAPAELMLGRMPRTKLSLLKPSVSGRMRGPEGFVYSREFVPGDAVLLRDLRPGSAVKWRPATVTARVGPLVYEVCVDGRTRRAHLDHLLVDRTGALPRPPVPERPVPAAVPGLVPARAESELEEPPTDALSPSAVSEPVLPPPETAEAPGGVPSRRVSGELSSQRWQRGESSDGALPCEVDSDKGLSGAESGGPVLRRSERLRRKLL